MHISHNRKCKGSIIILAMLAMMILTSFSLAENVSDEELPNPSLPPDAPKYDVNFPEELTGSQLHATSAILIEAQSGDVIFEKDADRLMHPASTTKILTVYLAALLGEEQGLMNETITASETAIANLPKDSSLIPLKVDETISFRDLLFATMVRSGNDGANVLAEACAGTIEDFVALMNDFIKDMGLKNTHFSNTHGYTDPSHYSTVRDMAAIAKVAMEDDLFKQTARLISYPLPQSNKRKAVTLKAQKYYFLDPDSKYFYPSAIGVKTGTTTDAGYCFVGAAEKDGITLISVVFYSGRYSRWEDTKKLLDYGFSQYTSATLTSLYEENPVYVNISGYSLKDKDLGLLKLNLAPIDENPHIVLKKKDMDLLKSNFHNLILVEYNKDLVAPVTFGESIGTLFYFPEDEDYLSYDLVASRAIGKRENAPKTIAEIEEEVYSDPNPLPSLTGEIVMILALFLFFTIWFMRFVLKIAGQIPKNNVKLPKRRYRKYN